MDEILQSDNKLMQGSAELLCFNSAWWWWCIENDVGVDGKMVVKRHGGIQLFTKCSVLCWPPKTVTCMC